MKKRKKEKNSPVVRDSVTMAEIQFFHFDVRGRGEAVRLLLHAAGQSFENVLVPRATWGPEAKAGEAWSAL